MVEAKQAMYRVSSHSGKFYQLFSFVRNIDLLSPQIRLQSTMTNSEFSYQNSKTKPETEASLMSRSSFYSQKVYSQIAMV